jgi:hypothetical protein
MGTRSAILITGKDDAGNDFTARLYRHYDGYPVGNVGSFINALEIKPDANAEELTKNIASLKYEDGRGVYEIDSDDINHGVSYLSGVKDSIQHRGDSDRNNNPLAFYLEPISALHFSNQSDLEWAYIIDTNTKNINIYGSGGNFRSGTIHDLMQYGTTTMDESIARWKDEYLAEARTEIAVYKSQLKDFGYSENQQEYPSVLKETQKIIAINTEIDDFYEANQGKGYWYESNLKNGVSVKGTVIGESENLYFIKLNESTDNQHKTGENNTHTALYLSKSIFPKQLEVDAEIKITAKETLVLQDPQAKQKGLER